MHDRNITRSYILHTIGGFHRSHSKTSTTVLDEYSTKRHESASLTSEYWLGSTDGVINAGSVAFALSLYLPLCMSAEMIDFAAFERILIGVIFARFTEYTFVSAALRFRGLGLTSFFPVLPNNPLHSVVRN